MTFRAQHRNLNGSAIVSNTRGGPAESDGERRSLNGSSMLGMLAIS